MNLEMLPLDPKCFTVVGFFFLNSWVSFYPLLKNQNSTLKVHKYLILHRKVWLSRWGIYPIHDLKHFTATLSCKSHWWHKPSCVLKCFVTFLTPESNFSCGRLSQRYVPTNPHRSGSKGWHSCPPSSLPPLESLEPGQTGTCELRGPHPTLPRMKENPCLRSDPGRQSERPCHVTTQTGPQGHPGCKLLLQMDI